MTIKEVAKLAGVSPSTVSRTFRNHPSISEQTKEKVRKAMAELGYEPNIYTTNFENKILKTIGVVFPASMKDAYENSFYLETLRGIGQFCNQKGYTVTIITGATEDELMKCLKNSQVDGFIFLYSNLDDSLINYMYDEKLLFVLIGKATKMVNETICVDNDNIQAGKDACEYLINLGHKKIGYIGTENSKVFSNDRKSGYILALTEHSIPFNDKYCIEIPYLPDNEETKLIELLSMKDRPTALVVCDDMITIAIQRTILSLGLSIPKDLSIICFNNSIFSRVFNPQLTSIDINSYQLGAESASQLINHIEQPDLFATKTIVPYYIIERESCRKID
ncbi:MAG: LacI family DNA-binding transcriptional regulator [Tyzzerella sp.]|uniref:LacI family DNA-binding transcriptional regulator n=1 Tax=Candidatus Fimicola merdigallinarum TaxID=2840819 RepID=A0A9D9DXL5_9FIRM|nr:LacI family DNA-binding transcriptional regulator [Candidatus Fimicola merdigallinarum]